MQIPAAALWAYARATFRRFLGRLGALESACLQQAIPPRAAKYSRRSCRSSRGNKIAASPVLTAVVYVDGGKNLSLPGPDKFSRFERAILPHLDAAYNLARWLMRNEDEAADAVQDACLRALRFIGSFRGGDGRVWLLAIVRNTCYSRLKRGAIREQETEFDDELHSPATEITNPEALLERSRDSETLRQALEGLPEEFREVVVMRELEGMAYKQIAEVAGVPLGTVMSRLARARKRLQQTLVAAPPKES